MFTRLIFICLLAVMIRSITAKKTSNIQIKSLGNDRPIYYDAVGKVQLIHDEWRLLMYYNLSTYWSGVQKFENYFKDIQDLCKSLEPKYCESTIHQLSHDMDMLRYYNEILLAPHQHLSGRKKRGLINGVGYLAHGLFGILDQRFADQYQVDIQNVRRNEDYLLELIKNQTSIVEIENKILKKTEENIDQEFTLLNKYINDTEMTLTKMNSTIKLAMATSFFSSTSLAAHLLLKNLMHIQETLFNTLVDIYKGRMDVHLLTPTNLIHQLTLVSGKLPRTLSLPVDNIQEEIKDIYKLIYVKARVTDSYFMYELHIPLASNEDYIMYHVLPLPMKHPQKLDETSAVLVSSNYIAVNLEKNTFLNINEKDLNTCIQPRKDNYVCILNLPIFNLQNGDAPCEAKLLGHQTASPCYMEKTKCETAWIELHNTNTWLVMCCDSCPIHTRIVCDDDVSSHVINHTSIVTLKQGCLLQTKDFKIHSHNNYDSKARLDYDIEIPSLDKTINDIVNTHNTPLLHLYHNEDIGVVGNQLQYIKSKNHLPEALTTHDIHHYTISYILLAVIGAGVIIWVAKKRGNGSKKTYEPSTVVVVDSRDGDKVNLVQ